MKFKIFSELSYDVFSPTTFIFNIQAAHSPSQVIVQESIATQPVLPLEEFSLNNANARFLKMQAGQGNPFTITYNAIVEVQYKLFDQPALLEPIPLTALNIEVLPYLFPSRYCQSDRLRKLATKEFGHLQGEYAKVSAISDWIFNNIDYISGATDSATSAYDTLIQREGVCRDFAHLAIALCRALDIPARYFTGYASNLNPPDFHACFEAYIGGQWLFFDATKLVPINGLVRIANSSDAADAAVASFFGNTICTALNVQCTAMDENFIPLQSNNGNSQAISYQ